LAEVQSYPLRSIFTQQAKTRKTPIRKFQKVAFKLQLCMISLYRYQTESGQEPITDWLNRLRDKRSQAKLRIRLKRLELGMFGDCESVGDGVLELREHLGAGYRVYFGKHGQTVVILLCGGDKKSQASDIATAKAYFADWKRRQG